jgi:hypothetical protein
MFGATERKGSRRRMSTVARCAATAIQNMQWGAAPAAQQNSAPTFIAAGRPDVVRELLAMISP